MKKIILVMMILGLLSTTMGCSNFYEVPVNLMRVPKLNDNYIKNQKYLTDSEFRVLIQSLMPEGYKLLEDNKSMEKQSIYDLDVDGDKRNEYVVLVRNSNKTNVGFFLVKNKYGKWVKVFEWLDEGIGIKTVKAVRGLNDEDVRVLVGNVINPKGTSEYYLFDFNEDWEGDYVDLGTWSELTIIQSVEDGINFIVENRDESTILDLRSITYDGESFRHNSATDAYQNKINEYKYMIDQYDGNESAWYYYIYAKFMTGRYDEALKDMNEYLNRDKTRDSIQVNDVKFLVLKSMILSKLNRNQEAQEIIDKHEIFFRDPEIIFAYDLSAYEFYYVAGMISKASGDIKMANYNFKKALDKLEKAHDKKLPGYSQIIGEVMEDLINDAIK